MVLQFTYKIIDPYTLIAHSLPPKSTARGRL